MDSTESISYSKNHWRTTDRSSNTIVGWSFFLPYPKSEKETQNMLDLFKSITSIAEEQDIGCICKEKVLKSNAKEIKSHFNYIEKDFLGEQINYELLDNFNEFPLFVGSPTFSTKLAYYDSSNEIVERYIGNMGKLIAKIYDIEVNRLCAVETTAIDFYTDYSFGFDGENYRHNESNILQTNIGLTTDIWFPWIDGDIHVFRPHGEEPYLQPVNHPTFGIVYDNRELVSYHTPRLNKFLSESHKIVSSYGGKWKLDTTEGGPMYAEMCSTLGVRLD
jgi:hypothetical protein